MRSTYEHTRTNIGSDDGESVLVVAPSDALTAPESDDLIGAALSFWPQGAAWGTPDGQAMSLASVLARFTRVLIDPFAWLYARAWRLARESTVAGVDELLPEWEADYGLPDNCVTGETSRAERLRALEAKVRAVAVSTPGDFIALAARYGFSITITEPVIFECGFSECGGEHETGAPEEECYWLVHVADLAIDYFECGFSECGHDPLFDLGDAERLMCILRRLAPAWTIPILAND
ncbi:hypothetical protein [Rhizobium cremeum]|uniref:hypothetical protein n=1 Tax=Rhizobium cremeum TaxID=2813827 RepID=UPI0039DF9A6C